MSGRVGMMPVALSSSNSNLLAPTNPPPRPKGPLDQKAPPRSSLVHYHIASSFRPARMIFGGSY